MTVPDDDVTAAKVSRDAVVTNATNAVGHWGARDLRAVADDMGWFMIMCLVSFDHRTTIVHGMDCMVCCAFEQISADICRYLQISAQISGHASRYLLPREDILHRNQYKL
jgi:hypothetical protein